MKEWYLVRKTKFTDFRLKIVYRENNQAAKEEISGYQCSYSRQFLIKNKKRLYIWSHSCEDVSIIPFNNDMIRWGDMTYNADL